MLFVQTLNGQSSFESTSRTLSLLSGVGSLSKPLMTLTISCMVNGRWMFSEGSYLCHGLWTVDSVTASSALTGWSGYRPICSAWGPSDMQVTSALISLISLMSLILGVPTNECDLNMQKADGFTLQLQKKKRFSGSFWPTYSMNTNSFWQICQSSIKLYKMLLYIYIL